MSDVVVQNLPCKSLKLFTPALAELAAVLQKGLEENFASVQVSVIDCPDLSLPPYSLASPGLCGDQKVVDVGGPYYLLPLANKEKLYRLRDIAKICGDHSGLMVGAGAGPWPVVGANCELMANINVTGDTVDVRSKVAKVNAETQLGETQDIDTDAFALMGNFYLSKGNRDGKVLEIKASHRTGPDNYMSSIRNTLHKHYGDQTLGLGGTFLVEKGKAKLHVMSEFSTTPINNAEQLNNWLKFYEYEGPVTALGYLLSHDPGLDVRIEHFHCFTDRGVGGHYHYDTTPEDVAYRGYFGLAETFYRIDAPPEILNFGKD
ncbi:ester hydrolase C11orf54 homolog [Watersipora subatra]|uniref:ester hydrolase C11orf54 homolog n=1 Tax=Watersipora subatra TaxID=2589382 RepID=UPI00355BB5B5